MPPVPFAKTGTAPEATAWNWDAATQNAVLGDTDDPNWGRYKQAHAWYEPDKDTVKDGFKLPHHHIEGDTLSAVWRGVANAMARLKQSDMPDGDMKGVFDHLASHYAQWSKTPPEWERFIQEVHARQMHSWMYDPVTPERSAGLSLDAAGALASGTSGNGGSLPMVATRAPVGLVRPGGVPADGDMERINALALRPLSPDDVYVVPVELNSDVVDAYFTRMTPKTLAQFAADANRGVAFCDSHDHLKLPIGRSFMGQVTPVERNGQQVLTAQALNYIVRGMALSNGLSSDDVIRGIDAGVYADISVGFIPEAFWCSICGLNMLSSFDCFHMPGMTYEQKTGEAVCVADVDARLAENSLVYDGAVPNAMVLKGQQLVEQGRATSRMLAFVEDHCRVKLVNRFPGFGFGLSLPAPVAAAAIPSVPAPAPAAAQPAAVAAAPATTVQEAPMPTPVLLSGSAFIQGVIDEYTRAGKQLSQANMDRLRAMQAKLQNGHDTMADAMREMGSFLDEKDMPAAESDGGDSGDEGDTDQRAGPDSGNGTNPDGTSKPPKDQPGKGDTMGDEDPDGSKTGAEDKDDAHPPAKGASAAKSAKGKSAPAAGGRATAQPAPATPVAPAPAPEPVYDQHGYLAASDEPEGRDPFAADAYASRAPAMPYLAGWTLAEGDRAGATDTDPSGGLKPMPGADDEDGDGDDDDPPEVHEDTESGSYEGSPMSARASGSGKSRDKVPTVEEEDDGKGSYDGSPKSPKGGSGKNGGASGEGEEPDDTGKDEGTTPPKPDETEDDADDYDGSPKSPKASAKAARAAKSSKSGSQAKGGDPAAEGQDGESPYGPDEDPGDEQAEEDGDAEGGDMDGGECAAEGVEGAKPSGAKKPTTSKRSTGAGAAEPVLTREQVELMEIGRRARASLVHDCVAAGARAFGATFNQDLYLPMLRGATFEQLEGLRAHWQQLARMALSPIGRFEPDPDGLTPGGGHWSSEPTGNGGRQTQARDPNDPLGVAGAGRLRQPSADEQRAAALARGVGAARPRGDATGNPDLYRIG